MTDGKYGATRELLSQTAKAGQLKKIWAGAGTSTPTTYRTALTTLAS
jgi:hypothetical protein